MYEARHLPIAPLKVFVKRIIRNLAIGLIIVLFSLGVGMAGYAYFEKMPLIDAYENAAMILSGMGPADTLKTVGGKIFAGTYALFSGIVFLIVIAIIMAPVFHRFLHRFSISERQ